MSFFSKDYIVPGDIFADESVLCIRCGTTVMCLSYKEMPKINNPKKTVKVAHKMKLGNYRLVPVVLYRRKRESITCLPTCKDCVKEIDPGTQSAEIVKQIVRAMQIEARWVGIPEDSVNLIQEQFADARIIRKMTASEIVENRILEG